MPDSIMYSEDMFVFLTPDATETFLTPLELVETLTKILAAQSGPLPPNLQKLASDKERANYLIETHCELETAPGESVQWYAVRLEK